MELLEEKNAGENWARGNQVVCQEAENCHLMWSRFCIVSIVELESF